MRRGTSVMHSALWVVALGALVVQFCGQPFSRAQDSLPAEVSPSSKDSAKKNTNSKADFPPALKSYKGRRIAQTMHFDGAGWLTRENRNSEEDCEAMLKALDVKPGQTVCDMGCGNGFYTLRLAEMVGEKSEVLAVDIQAEMLHLLEERAKSVDIKNVKLILGGLTDPRLPEGKLDLILCVDVYHEFSHPEHMLKAMRKALAPKGKLVLVEFRAEDRRVPILPLHKMSKKQILKELEPNGFKLVQQYDELPWQHMMFFERDESKED
ncbi:MAG: class I SAM-dependent methyltransferase [Planctomycetota bacterium]|nr:class I SAM-dependent methyltransferase [Planctomycetota bacterium]